MGVQTCPLAMIGSLQVEYSSWWLTLVSLTFHTYLLLQWVFTKLPHLTLASMVKKRLGLLLGLGVYIGVLTYDKFPQTMSLPWVRDISPVVLHIEFGVSYKTWKLSPISYKNVPFMVFILWSSPNHTPIMYRCPKLKKDTKQHPLTFIHFIHGNVTIAYNPRTKDHSKYHSINTTIIQTPIFSSGLWLCVDLKLDAGKITW